MLSGSNVMFMSCGSFSPVTHMHLRMFELARDHFTELGHSVLGGIISPVHDAYAKQGLVAATHRVAMLRLALRTSDWIRLSDYECLQQSAWSKTRHSLQWHQNYLNAWLMARRSVGDNGNDNGNDNVNANEPRSLAEWMPPSIGESKSAVQLKLLCGADLLESFAVPGLWNPDDIEAILEEHGLVVISRSGSNPERFIFESDILTKHKHHITIVTNWVPNEVSSSLTRRLLSRGASVKYIMDDAVIDYIQQYELFGSSKRTKRSVNANSNSQPASKYILSPNQNTYQLQLEAHNNAMNDGSVQSFVNYRYDDMDETDNGLAKPVVSVAAASDANWSDLLLSSRLMSAEKRSARVFCCADSVLAARPGGAVKIHAANTATATATATIDVDDEVGDAHSVRNKSRKCGDNHLSAIGDSSTAIIVAPPPQAHTCLSSRKFSADAPTTATMLVTKTDAAAAASVDNVQKPTDTANSILLSPTRLLDEHHAGGVGGQARSLTHNNATVRSRVQFVTDRQSKPNDLHVDGDCGEARLSGEATLPDTSDRTQDDLIQFVFTAHGIRVISNKEYVV